MASARRRKNAAVIEALAAEPYRFDFFQAVRILEASAGRSATSERKRRPVGGDHAPNDEVARFRAFVSHRFPAGGIQDLRLPASDEGNAEMTVAFLGAIGPSGVLPQHYTQLVIDRVRQKDTSLRDFLDIFHHRLISLFYRSWGKYRFPMGYERAAAENAVGSDPFTAAIFSIAGMGTGELRGRLRIEDTAFLYFSGLISQSPTAAVSLERLVEDYFGFPTEIVQFQGQWLYLATEDQSQLSRQPGWISNNQLGANVVAGQRVWGVENRFRVRLGPLGYDDFQRLMPDGDLLVPVAQFVRTCVGPEFDFDVQPILRAAEVPGTQLESASDRPARLGWNTWILGNPASRDGDEAIFVHEGAPD